MSPAELELNVRLRDRRRAYLEAHVFELLIGVLSVVTAVTFFAEPGDLSRTAIGQSVHPFDYGWNALYLAGGALITLGLARPSYRLEAAGLLMLAGAVTAGAVALIDVAGATAGVATLTAALGSSFAAAAACLVRVATIRRVERALLEANAELALRQPQRRRATDR